MTDAYERHLDDGRFRLMYPCKSHPGRWQLESGRIMTSSDGRKHYVTNDIWLTASTEAEARAWVDAIEVDATRLDYLGSGDLKMSDEPADFSVRVSGAFNAKTERR